MQKMSRTGWAASCCPSSSSKARPCDERLVYLQQATRPLPPCTPRNGGRAMTGRDFQARGPCPLPWVWLILHKAHAAAPCHLLSTCTACQAPVLTCIASCCLYVCTAGQRMFPMFRRRDNLKKLYIVRHGESTYNAAMHARGSSWADPQIYDAQLTEKGRQQARALREQLTALNLPPDTLWLTSPLARAMQTFLLACPHAHLLSKGSACDNASGSGSAGSFENSSSAPNGGGSSGGQRPPDVLVLHTITEKVGGGGSEEELPSTPPSCLGAFVRPIPVCCAMRAVLPPVHTAAPMHACRAQVLTCGDIGHPASELRRQFPQLDQPLAALPELWWHSRPAKPNCALQQCFGSIETKDQVLVSSWPCC